MGQNEGGRPRFRMNADLESVMIVAVKLNARVLYSAREVHPDQLRGDLPTAA